MCGIFAYLNHLKPMERRAIINILIGGLKRLEYRGYDSAGIAIDSGNESDDPYIAGDAGPLPGDERGIHILKEKGKVSNLEELVNNALSNEISPSTLHNVHTGIAHTRWATHGVPSPVNSHPQRSNNDNDFVVVHNGIITNYKQLKQFLEQHDYIFESETDTEVISKLMQYLYDHRSDNELNNNITFGDLVEKAISQLQGAFACVFKSRHFPGELVATRRGSPLLVGIKSESKLSTDHIPILFSAGGDHVKSSAGDNEANFDYLSTMRRRMPSEGNLGMSRQQSETDIINTQQQGQAVEYFFASDASAIIEHTKKVLVLEDDDVAAVCNGRLSLHRMKRDTNNSSERAIKELEMELENIMKGKYECFMQKEIFEQPESVVNTIGGV